MFLWKRIYIIDFKILFSIKFILKRGLIYPFLIMFGELPIV